MFGDIVAPTSRLFFTSELVCAVALTTVVLFRTEVRWMERWFRTILPNDGDTGFVGVNSLPIASFIRDYLGHTPFGSNLGVRIASIVLMALCSLRYLRPFQKT